MTLYCTLMTLYCTLGVLYSESTVLWEYYRKILGAFGAAPQCCGSGPAPYISGDLLVNSWACFWARYRYFENKCDTANDQLRLDIFYKCHSGRSFQNLGLGIAPIERSRWALSAKNTLTRKFLFWVEQIEKMWFSSQNFYFSSDQLRLFGHC